MRLAFIPFIAIIMLAATPGSAHEPDKQPAPEKPITEKGVTAMDVATMPATDLNLKHADIPPLLIAAQAQPYGLSGLSRCDQIASAVSELDVILGEDIDVAQAKRHNVSPGSVAQYVVGSFIPFRDAIRELSGANSQDHRMQAAIYAGSARRAFLKGVGQQRGCRYPARSATPDVLALAAAKSAPTTQIGNQTQEQAKAPGGLHAKIRTILHRRHGSHATHFVTQPVVQNAK